ncbi:MAG: EAL domain-containing protein [Pseudomonadota bacterium]
MEAHIRLEGSGAVSILRTHRTSAWKEVIAHSLEQDELELYGKFGRLWTCLGCGEHALSVMAARYLGVEPGPATVWRNSLRHVVADDLPQLLQALDAATGCEFRLIDPLRGMRWLRLVRMEVALPGIDSAMLVDITSDKHAVMRERFNFALTRYLIGTNTLSEAINKIIQLVCEELSWEWGAYWSLESGDGAQVLRCRHSWYLPGQHLEPFRDGCERFAFAPGEGVVGTVWESGQAQWIDDPQENVDFMRADLAGDCGLQAGYLFPVTYVAPDGSLHSPGVLEFFSVLPRQHEAQLPGLAESISALIAQAAQRMVQQERIRMMAQTDEMTGLANRSHFHSYLDDACQVCPPGQSLGILYIDLDKFKPINDAFGHEAGNVVLVEFARRLARLVTPGGLAARLGGDEFVILTPAGANIDQLNGLAEQVLRAARAHFAYQGRELAVSASIGISIFPEHGASAAKLLHSADAAMYKSKRSGRNLASHFSGDADRQQLAVAKELTLLSELHSAHVRNEFFLDYQPIYDTANERLLSVEALIRWRKSDGEVVPPAMFIPAAEQSRLIVHLGRWVVEQVCRDMPLLKAAGLDHVQVNINLAAPSFHDAELPRELMAVVNAARVDPGRICLELTEGVAMSSIDKSLPIMQELQRLGFEVSLDDFGMGYSSLSMLKKLPIASLKIDRLFVAGLPHDRDDCAIVRTILDLGRNMKLRVVAEGVETDAQLAYLRQFGCPMVQGYLLGRPMPLARLIALHGIPAGVTP